MTTDATGDYTLTRPSLDRQLAMDAFAATDVGHPMVGLMELDVTDALAAIHVAQTQGQRVSLFAFVVRCIAVAISEHPELNQVRHGKRIARFDDVDIAVPVEVQSREGRVPREVVVRCAHRKSAQEIYAELEHARVRHETKGETSDEDRWARRMMRSVRWLPAPFRVGIVRWIVRSAFRIKAHNGTTLVTSVGKFAAIPGFSFTFSTGPRAALFVVGGVVDKAWVHAGVVEPRSVLSLSVMVDHDLVDGGPAARFARRLRALVESGDGLLDAP
jgi:pyruvate/2-oxoglutarate dehydrogenase complex dihydrolipoamide acyltransferase (E2) component